MEKRLLLFAFLSFVVIYYSMNYMQRKYGPRERARTTQQAPTPDGQAGIATTTGTQTTIAPAETSAQSAATAPVDVVGPTVPVRTGVYDILFSTNGAVPVQWDIIDQKYVSRPLDAPTSETLREPLIDPKLLGQGMKLTRPFETVLQELNSRFYSEFNRMVFEHRAEADGLTHTFTSPPNAAGLTMTKVWKFEPTKYTTRLRILLTNQGSQNLNFGGGGRGLGVVLGPGIGETIDSTVPMDAYSGVHAVVNGRDGFLHEEIKKAEPERNTTLGDTVTLTESRELGPIYWGGIENKYFMAALAADATNPVIGAQAVLDNRVLGTLTRSADYVSSYPSVELYSAPFVIAPGETREFAYTVYMGPKQRKLLDEAGHEFDRGMFHTSGSLIRSLCLLLMPILFWLHGVLGNWGLAIIFLTVIVRLATLPLVHKGMKSQAKMTQEMNKIKPLVERVNEKYKDDPTRKQQEIWKLYREHNINPLGMMKGCVWMLIQMPIFIGLYALLMQVIDLRGAEFLWIRDLSQPDQLFPLPVALPWIGPYFNLLPIIVAITQMLTSKFMQTPATDPQQIQMQKMMTWFMPIIILVFTYRFPSGLMLYWLVSNAWQVVQQVYVNKVIRKPEVAATA